MLNEENIFMENFRHQSISSLKTRYSIVTKITAINYKIRENLLLNLMSLNKCLS